MCLPAPDPTSPHHPPTPSQSELYGRLWRRWSELESVTAGFCSCSQTAIARSPKLRRRFFYVKEGDE